MREARNEKETYSRELKSTKDTVLIKVPKKKKEKEKEIEEERKGGKKKEEILTRILDIA